VLSYRFPLPVRKDCDLNISEIIASLTNAGCCCWFMVGVCPLLTWDGELSGDLNIYTVQGALK